MSFWNISKDVNILKFICYDRWNDFKYFYQKEPIKTIKQHPCIVNPRSLEHINFRQFVTVARDHNGLISYKLNGITNEPEELKKHTIAKQNK